MMDTNFVAAEEVQPLAGHCITKRIGNFSKKSKVGQQT
jgi:hypothetical protein